MIFSRLIRAYKKQRFYRAFFPADNLLVFDIGAHQGKKTELFLKSGCKVIAIEPQKSCLPDLKNLSSKYPSLLIEHCAVSDIVGTSELFIGAHTETSTISNAFRSVYEKLGTAHYLRTENVQTTTLSLLIEKYGIPYFLKIDAEGHEEKILQDLKSPVPVIEFEYLKPFRASTVQSILLINALSNYEFNFCVNENPYFHFSKWETAEEFVKRMYKLPENILHGNIYARSL
jgi:FkbM family methyltransferase